MARWDSLLWHIQERVGGWVSTHTVKDEHTCACRFFGMYNTIQKMGSIHLKVTEGIYNVTKNTFLNKGCFKKKIYLSSNSEKVYQGLYKNIFQH